MAIHVAYQLDNSSDKCHPIKPSHPKVSSHETHWIVLPVDPAHDP